jgi:D-hexose-6-phosphate mutarotase
MIPGREGWRGGSCRGHEATGKRCSVRRFDSCFDPCCTFADSVSASPRRPLIIVLLGFLRQTQVQHVSGFTDYILWNPFGNAGMGYESFVCVESGVVSAPVTLQPGEAWTGVMKILASTR